MTDIPAGAVATPPPGMALIPAGAFTMGNTVAADTDITTAVPVNTTVSAFYMDVNEVSLSQWQSVYYWTTTNDYTFSTGQGKGPNHPVQAVSWYDVVKWCNARSEQAGKTPVYYTNDEQTTIWNRETPHIVSCTKMSIAAPHQESRVSAGSPIVACAAPLNSHERGPAVLFKTRNRSSPGRQHPPGATDQGARRRTSPRVRHSRSPN